MAKRKLNTYVIVDRKIWGPDDDVPDEVLAKIHAPGVFEGDEPTAAEDGGGDPAAESEVVELEEPPESGAGSGKEAWHAYAEQLGVEVPDDSTRDEIIAFVRAGAE